MIRVNSYYTEQQVALLGLLVKKTGIKQAELLRRAVDLYLSEMRKQGMIDDPNL